MYFVMIQAPERPYKMETALIFAETVFYFTVSLAVIALGVFSAMVTCRLVRIARELEELSINLNHASSEAGERIHDIIDRLSEVPILSHFLKKSVPTRNEKGREKSSKK